MQVMIEQVSVACSVKVGMAACYQVIRNTRVLPLAGCERQTRGGSGVGADTIGNGLTGLLATA